VFLGLQFALVTQEVLILQYHFHRILLDLLVQWHLEDQLVLQDQPLL